MKLLRRERRLRDGQPPKKKPKTDKPPEGAVQAETKPQNSKAEEDAEAELIIDEAETAEQLEQKRLAAERDRDSSETEEDEEDVDMTPKDQTTRRSKSMEIISGTLTESSQGFQSESALIMTLATKAPTKPSRPMWA